MMTERTLQTVDYELEPLTCNKEIVLRFSPFSGVAIKLKRGDSMQLVAETLMQSANDLMNIIREDRKEAEKTDEPAPDLDNATMWAKWYMKTNNARFYEAKMAYHKAKLGVQHDRD